MTVAQAGCTVFVVHARQAVLNGLSPKENREIPPLQYDVVRRLRADFPALTFVVNGGVRTVEDVLEHLRLFDGVMIGREAYQNPYLLAQLHQAVVDPQWSLPSREEVVERYVPYVRAIGSPKAIACARWCATCRGCTPVCRACARGADFFPSSAAAPDARTRTCSCDALRIVRAAA